MRPEPREASLLRARVARLRRKVRREADRMEAAPTVALRDVLRLEEMERELREHEDALRRAAQRGRALQAVGR